MNKQTKLHFIKLLSLTVVAAITIIIGLTISISAQDKIEYNQVYDCGEGKQKFKVLNCKGMGKFDTCETFDINELSPGGGFKGSSTRALIEDYYLNREGCKIKNRVAVNSETNKKHQSENPPVSKNEQTPAREESESAAACSASSNDSEGKTANEKAFRGVIRRLWEKEARKGSDGAVTITFQKVVVGAPRAWRANISDAYSQADPRKPIYPVRATFATCTDYRAAVSKRKMERIYDCFVHKTGGWQCTQTGASGALALKDEEEYIQKRQ